MTTARPRTSTCTTGLGLALSRGGEGIEMQQSRLDGLAWLIAGVGLAMFIVALVVTSRVRAAVSEGHQNDDSVEVTDHPSKVGGLVLEYRLD